MSVGNRRVLMLAVPLLWITVLASAAGAIYAKHRARELFVQLEQVNAERDRLDIEFGRMQLEQSACFRRERRDHPAAYDHAAAGAGRSGDAMRVSA